MGYHVNHTIVVTCWDIKLLRRTWKEAKSIFSGTGHHISNITPPANNCYQSYLIAPDGSKQGWETSIKGWNARKKFITYLKEFKPYPPGWVLVQFDDDNHHTLVLDSNDHFNPEANYFDDWAHRVLKPVDHWD